MGLIVPPANSKDELSGLLSLHLVEGFSPQRSSPLCYIRLLVSLDTPKLAVAIKEGVSLHGILPAVTGKTNKLLMWTVSP